jgi:hypothetical protein
MSRNPEAATYRKQERRVAHAGDQAIVSGRVHHQRVRADRLSQPADGWIVAGQDPGRTLEQLRVGAVDAGRLAAAHGMPADEVDARSRRPLHDAALRAGHVGHDLAFNVAAQAF